MTMDNPFAPLSDTAMILAAGLGTRLRPLTYAKPKPLFEIGGRTMLDRALDKLEEAGLKRAVVNAHYLGEQIEKHLAARKGGIETILSFEKEILDTGGGVKNALSSFGDKPFFVLNADLPWTEGAVPALLKMAQAWDSAKMDVLMLVQETGKARGFHGSGDFMMNPDGALWRKEAPQEKPFVWLSAMLVDPALYDAVPDRIFSNNKIFDSAEKRGRLFGVVHDGTCFQIGTPEDLKTANILLQTGVGWG